MIGPPNEPPNCSSERGFFGAGDWLNAHGLLAQLKKLRASIAPSRPKANAVPCRLLVPDLRPTLTTAPGFQPYSAGGFSWMLNSWIASIGRMVAESPAIPAPLIIPWPEKGSLLNSPSTTYALSSARRPLVLVVENPPPG